MSRSTHRAGFAYVTGVLADRHKLRLCRLRYGYTAGTPEEALDTACGLYLGDSTAWITPPKN